MVLGIPKKKIFQLEVILMNMEGLVVMGLTVVIKNMIMGIDTRQERPSWI